MKIINIFLTISNQYFQVTLLDLILCKPCICLIVKGLKLLCIFKSNRVLKIKQKNEFKNLVETY